MPEYCEYGRSEDYDVDASEVVAAVKSGIEVYTNIYNPQAWVKFISSLASILDSVDYLRYEGPKHVLQGQVFTAKGNLFDPFVNVDFHNSEKGYTATDKSNLEANAYASMSFDQTYGMGLAWVTNDGLCSSEAVWVQKRPTIQSADAWHSGGRIYADVSYLVDKYSKAALSSSTPVRITISARSDVYGGVSSRTVSASSLEDTQRLYVFPGAGGGPYSVSVTVSDGNFSARESVGFVNVPGSAQPPCDFCQPL